MPITNHTGLPRSGKSYDVVVRSIIPAAKAGRRILTSITGVNAALLEDRVGRPVDVRFMTKAEIIDPLSYPAFDDATGNVTEHGKVIRAGDFIAWDEIHRYWKDSSRVADEMPERIREFFRYHGKIDVVIHMITHNPDDVPPFLRRVVDATIDTVNMRNLGLGSRYRRIVYARDKHDPKLRLGQKSYKYDKRNYHLYQSFSHGNDAVVTAAATSSTFKFALFLAIGGPLFFIVLFVWTLTSPPGGSPPAKKKDPITLGGQGAQRSAATSGPTTTNPAVADLPGNAGASQQRPSGALLSMPPMDQRQGSVQQVAGQQQPAPVVQNSPQAPQDAATAVQYAQGYQYAPASVQASQQPPRRRFGAIDMEPFPGQLSKRAWKCPTSGDSDSTEHDPRC